MQAEGKCLGLGRAKKSTKLQAVIEKYKMLQDEICRLDALIQRRGNFAARTAETSNH